MNLKNAGVFLGSQNKHWIEGGFRILREICVCFFWGGGGQISRWTLVPVFFFGVWMLHGSTKVVADLLLNS